jgi:hypothetical protein
MVPPSAIEFSINQMLAAIDAGLRGWWSSAGCRCLIAPTSSKKPFRERSSAT